MFVELIVANLITFEPVFGCCNTYSMITGVNVGIKINKCQNNKPCISLTDCPKPQEFPKSSEYIGGTGMQINKVVVMDIFEESLGKWRNKNIVYKGSDICSTELPRLYVDFKPTFENISIHMYNVLAPKIERYCNVEVTFVEVVGPSGSAKCYKY